MKAQFKIGDRTIGPGNPTFIIAEAGSNHNRDLGKAHGLIEIAADAGADAVKFQSFLAERLVAKSEALPDGTNLCELFGKYELPREWHGELMDFARSLDIEFISSPFDFDAVDLLDCLDVCAIKIASGDLDNIPLITHIASKKRPIILSTGMGSVGEVGRALETIVRQGCEEVVLMHCVSSYPSPPEAMNLKAIETLRDAFKVPVGLSDHTIGMEIPIAATALGIDILEKHFTDARDQEGLDHSYSMEPSELKGMVAAIRTVEKAIGTGEKVCSSVESGTKYYARRGIFAKRDIPPGKAIERDDIKLVRPQMGIAPVHLDIVIGRRAVKAIAQDEPITWECV
ncbi:MAG: N-acetylneuraminate synthase family protein [Candidatus Coatesbacteria bacterium]|nr:N-acetylneuraminate synthase family protein [Candidatus Coatesbacteria bacterium]